ncbi:MAG TPA: ribosome-associated translation inhibitor RaiA [Acidisoma sp.]|uniref:ribosome hibernation-promoting factor, HPF/YfiA family n=1 Tax=Acidisoma sp. TaxID=1872115 RepID=UPI002B8F9394|nr:ribosome-associated translation inhibitor RaiA [Acidisoma sp.]HTH99981.1 ribosome-associated translation inhibitor RaiA [Acidisoma sp.]
MQITVSGKQLDLSDALRHRVATMLETISRKYFGDALEAHVTFSRARSFFTCDINMHAGRGLTLRGEGEAADANAALDDAAEHIAKRLRRYRRRVNEHARDMAQRDTPESFEPAQHYILQQQDDEEPASSAAEVVRPVNGSIGSHFATVVAENPAVIARLTVGEAVMRMDLADQSVVMFRNAVTGQFNVVYRRQDGHIGWIDPAAD